MGDDLERGAGSGLLQKYSPEWIEGGQTTVC